MTINFTQSGKELALKNIVGRTFSNNLVAKLYTNNVVLSNSTTIDDIIECSSDGYQTYALLSGSWTFDGAYASYPIITYYLNEEVEIYGYFVTQNDILLYL